MVKKYPVLTDEAVGQIRDLIQDYHRRVANPQQRPKVDRDDYMSPEVYVAKTPAGGIPALTVAGGLDGLDQPGAADCDIYYSRDDAALNPELEQTDFQVTVLNLSSSAVAGDSLVIVERDKFGRWWVASAAVSGGGALTCPCPPTPDCRPEWVQYNVSEPAGTAPTVTVLFTVPPGTIISAIRVYVASAFATGSLDVGYTDNVAAWDMSVSYSPGDQASIGGNNYICILANLNQSPPNATYWTLTGPTANNPAAFLSGFVLTSAGTGGYGLTAYPQDTPSFTESVDIIATYTP